MKEKVIWIFNHYAVTPDIPCPGITRPYYLGREWVKRGWRVVVFSSSFHHRVGEKERQRGWARTEEVEGVKFVWIKTFPYQRNDFRRVLNILSFVFLALFSSLKRLGGKPGVVIGSSPYLLQSLIAWMVSKFYRAIFIMEVRDFWPQTLIDMGVLKEKSFITRLLYLLEKFLYLKANWIVTVLPGGKEYMKERGISPEKVILIPNGVDISLFKEKRERKNSKFKVVYTGAHGPANNLETVLEAAKILKEKGFEAIEFSFYGDGPEKPKLLKFKEKEGLTNVKFYPSVPRKEIPRVLARAEVCVFTLKDVKVFQRYGLGSNKLLDYMASKTPVIMALNPVKNPVEEAKCGIVVPPENPEKLAQGILFLYRLSPEERKIMGERGYRWVKEKHRFNILASKFESLFKI